jgi:putative flippase GtrA
MGKTMVSPPDELRAYSLIRLARRIPSRQVYRFLVAGGAASLVNWLSRFAFSLFVPFETAVIMASAVGMTVGFLAYSTWVFPGSPLSRQTQVSRFLAVNLMGAAIVFAVSVPLVSNLSDKGVPVYAYEGLAHGVGIACAGLFNFVGHRLFSFAHR